MSRRPGPPSQPLFRPSDEPPLAREVAENAVIVAIFIWPQTHVEIFPFLTYDIFNDDQLAIVFRAAHKVFARQEVPDFVTVRAALEEEEGMVPPWYTRRAFALEQVDLEAGVSPSNVKSWVALIRRQERFARFKQGAASARTISDATRIASEFLENEGMIADSDEMEWGEAVSAFVSLQDRISKGEVTHGSSWGIKALDDTIMLVPGCFYVVAGIKKGGKSHFLQHVLLSNATIGNPSFLFSLEMGLMQVIRRWIAAKTGINSRDILTTRLMESAIARINEFAPHLAMLPLKVNQQARVTPGEILARVRAWKRKERIPQGRGIVGVDFLQLMPRTQSHHGQSDASAIKDIAYELARIAKECEVALVAATQFNNAAEGERVDSSSVRFIEGSGGIAQAAEGILLLDLHARRGLSPNSPTANTNGIEPIDLVVLQRNGESGRRLCLSVDLSTSRFFG